MFGRTQEEGKDKSSLEVAPSIEPFMTWAQAELRLRPESLQKYRSCLVQIERSLAGRPLETFSRDDLWKLKAGFVERGVSDSWAATSLLILKRYLGYARQELGADCLEPSAITPPKRKRKEVDFLTSDEVERFVGAIKLLNQDGSVDILGLRFRALVEVLLGSALRISELLSIDRSQIDFNKREARVVGKGGRERVAFFTARSLYFLKQYLGRRTDDCPAMFTDRYGRARWKRTDIWRPFNKYKVRSGIDKRIRPHLLRHTAATQLLFNGCPIGHIKEILGHARLETTCRYYLGVDNRAAKQAHAKYMTYA